MIATLKRNWFLLGIVVALTLGFAVPEAGRRLNPGSITTNTIVVAMFLISGFTLPSESILKGLANWRLHLYIQAFIFVVAPLLFFATVPLLRGAVPEGLIIGILALGVLPTTVTSCIVFTQISGGNAVGSMFNAAASNMAGVVLSPLLLSLLLSQAGQGLPPDQIMRVLGDLALKMLLPVVIGQLLHQVLRRFATEHRSRFGIANNVLVLLTVFFAVSGSARNPAFAAGIAPLLLPAAYLAAAHLALVTLAGGGARALGFPQEDVISVLYAAPQKTLVMGVPLVGVYFAQSPELQGIAVLPLLFYHPFQLMVAGLIRSSRLVRERA